MPLTQNDIKKLELEKDQYSEAKKLGLSFTDYLAKLEQDAGYEPKGDAASLDAFERQLAAHGIAINGNAAMAVDGFFATDPSSRVLFPEYVNRQISLGMDWGKKEVRMDHLVSARQENREGTARIPAIDFDKEMAKARKVGEGAKFPTARIGFKDKTVTLGKIGIRVEFAYEYLRRVALPVANIMLQRIGHNIRKQKAELALKILKDGDGNSGSAAPTSDAGGTWTYAEYVKAILSAPDGHEFSHLCVNKDFLQLMLTDSTNFPQFQSRSILERFLQTGEVQDFMGITWTTHEGMAAEAMLIWEQAQALIEYYEPGASLVETDKWINQQIEGSVISETFAFGKPFESAAHYKTKS